MRPTTAVLPKEKKVFENCTDEYHYQRGILKHVTINEKNLEAIMKMTSITPRSGGQFRKLVCLNQEFITVRELEDILYYTQYKIDFEKQKDYYNMQIVQVQDDYQRQTLKRGNSLVKKNIILKPKNSKRNSKERFTNKKDLNIRLEDLRPETVQRFQFQGQRYLDKNGNPIDQEIEPDSLQFEGEKKRLKEERILNKKEYQRIKTKIVTMKKDNSIPFFRYKEINKAGVYSPDMPNIPTLSIKAKNIQNALLEDLFKKKEVKKMQTQGTQKVMRKIKYQRAQMEKNKDLLNQSFNSEGLDERKEQEAIKFRDSSSENDLQSLSDNKSQNSYRSGNNIEGSQQSNEDVISTGSIQHQQSRNNFYSEDKKGIFTQSTQKIQSPTSQGSYKILSIPTDQSMQKLNRCFSEDDLKQTHEQKKENYTNQKVQAQVHINGQQKNFRMMVNRAHREVYKKKDFQEAQKIVRQELFKGHFKYEDLKTSDLKMEYIKLSRDKNLFKESQDYFKRHKEFLENNPYYKEWVEENQQNGKIEDLKNYDDLLLLYLNCKQNEHKKQDVKKLRMVINKICPTDPESHFKHKKRHVIEKIQKDLIKLSEQEFTRLQTLLNIYSKLDSFPPSIKNFDKWLEINRIHQQNAYEKEEQFKKHVASLPQTKEKNAKRQFEQKEQKRQQVSLMNTIKVENNYFLSPKNNSRNTFQTQADESISTQKQNLEILNLKEHKSLNNTRPMTAITTASTAASTSNLHHKRLESAKSNSRLIFNNQSDYQSEMFKTKKISSITKVGFIEKQMSQANSTLKKQKNVQEEWEPLQMKGSILEYMPQYNNFWNDLKQKVFPLGTLEQIIKDPSKYNHTKDIMQNELKKQERAEVLKKQMSKKISSKLLDEYDATQKKVIGSKYRFIQTPDQLFDPKKNKISELNDQDLDISLYLDDVCETSQILEKKVTGKTNVELYDMNQRRDKIQKKMEKEGVAHPVVHHYNMMGRIVKYSYKKHE
eukprot:403333566